MEKVIEDASKDTNRSDEYEFLRIGRKQKRAAVDKALARVKSMIHHPEACEQYMRLVSKFDKSGNFAFSYYFLKYSCHKLPMEFLIPGSCCCTNRLFCNTELFIVDFYGNNPTAVNWLPHLQKRYQIFSHNTQNVIFLATIIDRFPHH